MNYGSFWACLRVLSKTTPERTIAAPIRELVSSFVLFKSLIQIQRSFFDKQTVASGVGKGRLKR